MNIARDLGERGIAFDLIGGLDEYPLAGDLVAQAIEIYGPFDYAVISGVPHAIPAAAIEGIELFSITNGPRQVRPLREMGHKHVLVEIDLHPKTMGITSMIESEFGATLRQMAAEK